eukprot:CAMPEP_0172587556 /NCGR_PEP_ID=MMETSP1068-20121228/6591_1 /TAXON_ID=35684 /ORGANISM="Pseudopedinella elastica, Strain CCMP716" /LENGTH=126 /DNA_ID=CAMNT_0013382613 /DNA_START=79 /DNA_END=457 /DNA_ORIENTATION=-
MNNTALARWSAVPQVSGAQVREAAGRRPGVEGPRVGGPAVGAAGSGGAPPTCAAAAVTPPVRQWQRGPPAAAAAEVGAVVAAGRKTGDPAGGRANHAALQPSPRPWVRVSLNCQADKRAVRPALPP